MTTKRRYSLGETRIETHLKWLEQLETLPLTESCCDICHCDCYSSHRSELTTEDECVVAAAATLPLKSATPAVADKKPNGKEFSCSKAKVKTKVKVKCASTSNNNTHNNNNNNIKSKEIPGNNNKSSNIISTSLPKDLNKNCAKGKETLRKKSKTTKRSQSVGSHQSPSGQCSERFNTKDCARLHELLTSLGNDNTEKDLKINGISTANLANCESSCISDVKSKAKTMRCSSRTPPPSWSGALGGDTTDSSLAPIKLSESMANLCLVPTIREAYQKVPMHDKRILNRMAHKRTENAVAKENAWLARKYWENERYERELLKCEQMEEYKKAVRDKQFQDYLQTKSRLNEIAQRDLAELQRLRDSLRLKDDKAKKRLSFLRNERDLVANQKRCDDLRKVESVIMHQEEQNLDEIMRKNDSCQRLTERLKRADHIRNQILENYLKRLRYDNYIEQLQHEEHWREVQLGEQLKREQLKEQISRKRCRSQHFVQSRQQRNENIRNTAKLSQSLRELVRTSVTPDAGVTLFGGSGLPNLNNTASHYSSYNNIGKLLLDRQF